MRRYPLAVVIAVSVALVANIGLTTAQASEDELDVSDFLPSFEGFRWRVSGIADYGHQLTISSISVGQETITYRADGEVDDLSGGESGKDYSLSVSYVVSDDAMVQRKSGETMLDSKWDEIELLRDPIEEDATWQQTVGEGDDATTLSCTIEDVGGERGERVVKIRYEDVDGPYYEYREIQEHVGVVGFERLMLDGDEPYEVTYSTSPEATVLPPTRDFTDVTEEDWFFSYLGAPQRMGLIRGYPDDTFRPDSSISVAEFIKTVVSALGYPATGDGEPWHRPYVGAAEEFGLIESDDFEVYDRSIRREEMALLLARAEGTPVRDDGDTSQFSDSHEIGEDFQPYVAHATEKGLLKGYRDGSFRPEKVMTRAEAVRVLWSLIHNKDHGIFRPEDAVALEGEFEDRFYQDTIGDEDPLPRVEDFDRMDDLVDHLVEIMDRDLAESYVNDYYEERSDRLYLIPKDGPTSLQTEEDFDLSMKTPTRYQLTQEGSSGLVGDYVLTITYGQRGDDWIMVDREVEVEE
ncbi:MAG: S-layer homology domain-containing protein [Clostridia bacterium]